MVVLQNIQSGVLVFLAWCTLRSGDFESVYV